MRKLLAMTAVSFCCTILTGAAGIPDQPAAGVYANDYASILSDEDRADIDAASSALYEKTGVSAIVLTVESLNGTSVEEYGAWLVSSWGLDGNFALLLVGVQDEIFRLAVGENFASLTGFQLPPLNFKDDNLSAQIAKRHASLLSELYEQKGIAPAKTQTGGLPTSVILVLAVALLATGRSLRTGRKYRKKYLKGFVRKRKSFVQTYNEEDQYQNDEVYQIKGDDMD